MKKILITAHSLEIGGIEKALINLINNLKDKYDINLILEKKEGELLELLPSNVSVEEYRVSESKNIIKRKLSNFFRFLDWKNKNKNKYDFSICYATYSLPGKKLALTASKKNAIWIHGNYSLICKDNNETIKFFKLMELEKFTKCIFVSKDALLSTINLYPIIKNKSYVCHNYVNEEEIIKFSKCDINYKKDNEVLFVNVGRHEEESKKLSRLINVANKLNENGYNFKILMIGDGPHHNNYIDLVNQYNLNDKVIFEGMKKNPFPYYNIADCVVLTSEYEGYPVVFLEALTLNKPIISTKVSDYEELLDYGVFVEKNEDEIYNAMENFINKKIRINKKFNIENFNKEIDKKIDETINK